MTERDFNRDVLNLVDELLEIMSVEADIDFDDLADKIDGDDIAPYRLFDIGVVKDLLSGIKEDIPQTSLSNIVKGIESAKKSLIESGISQEDLDDYIATGVSPLSDNSNTTDEDEVLDDFTPEGDEEPDFDEEDADYQDEEELGEEDDEEIEDEVATENADDEIPTEETEEESAGKSFKINLDGTNVEDRRKPQKKEEKVDEKTEDTDEKPTKKKKSSKKASKTVPTASYSVENDLDIDYEAPLMSEVTLGTSGVLIDGNSGKVCDKENTKLQVIDLDINKIHIGKRVRVRIPDQKLQESIASNGVLEPITVAKLKDKDEYVVINGAKRLNACLLVGIQTVPCVVGHKWKCNDLAYLEGITNMQTEWGGSEHIAFARKCLSDGIRNEAIVESLCNMDEGEAHKSIDIFTDGDNDILVPVTTGKLYSTEISKGYKKLEARRKKEREEGLEEGDLIEDKADTSLEDDEDREIVPFNADFKEEDFADTDEVEKDLEAEVEKGKSIDGYSNHKQKVGEREYIDPAIRKATMVKCGNKCLCCGKGGESYVDCLDFHHVVPVYLGGEDSVENGTMLCILCHRQVHLYGCGDLHLDESLTKKYSELTEDKKLLYPTEADFRAEKIKMRNIVKLGNLIREGAKKQGLSRDKMKEAHPVGNLGRRRPGKNGVQTQA